jgi:hypothetical protein
MSLPAFTRTASDVVAEILMTRTAFVGPIVLVEGSTDSRFLKRHLLPIVQLTICGGKQTALIAVSRIVSLSVNGCLAVLDRDFDDHKGIILEPNIVYTDTHDTETLLLSFRLETLLNELGDERKLAAFRNSHGDLTNSVLERAAIFGRLRYVNEVQPAFHIGMDQFTPWRYMDHATWLVKEPELVGDFAGLCGYTHEQIRALLKVLAHLKTWKDVQGHDAIKIISIGLRQVLGNGNPVGEHQLATSLRLAFTEEDFKRTQLYVDIKGWEEKSSLTVLAH